MWVVEAEQVAGGIAVGVNLRNGQEVELRTGRAVELGRSDPIGG